MKFSFSRFGWHRLVYLVVFAVVVKALWFGLSVALLSFQDVDYVPKAEKNRLFYTSQLDSGTPPKPPSKRKPPKKTVPQSTIREFTLLAIYHSDKTDVATLRYKNKVKVLSRGEVLAGFTLKGGGLTYAIFEKKGKEYRLDLKDVKKRSKMLSFIDQNKVKSNQKNKEQGEIIFDGVHHIIPRSLFETYAGDLKEIYKNIGLIEVRNGKKIEGFKVTYIRKGSVFSKLGLKPGDVLTAFNGTPLTSFKAAFDAYRNIRNTTSATIQVKRGDTTLELQYEID